MKGVVAVGGGDGRTTLNVRNTTALSAYKWLKW